MKKMIICNHKMYLTYDEARAFKERLDDIDKSNIDLIVCPSFTNLGLFNKYKLGSQDAFYEDKGAFTGEVSAYFLSLIGVKYSILGHFERRACDSNEIINKKVKSALRNSIIPILCIGESKMEKDLMKSSEVIKKQLKEGLKGVTLNKDDEIIIAYEPGWAIGNESSLTKDEILDALSYIRKILSSCNINNYKLIYGGSINKDNIGKILSDEIDGYLIGQASTNANQLEKIIKSVK